MAKKKKPTQTRALVIKSLSLTSKQKEMLQMQTDPDFIKTRKGKKGKTFSYVEAGYVLARLNEIFGALNWSTEVLKQGETDRKVDDDAEGEVWVRLRLTIHDHKNGYNVFKDAYGQHAVRGKTPIGDSFKAAQSDAIKKAASAFGVALDVYWESLDQGKPEEQKGLKKTELKVETKATARKRLLDAQMKKIEGESSSQIVYKMRQKLIELPDGKPYTKAEKTKMLNVIDAKLGLK